MNLIKDKLTWIDEARVIASQCWCAPETEDIIMNPALAEIFAQRIAAWMEEAALYQKNSDYWRDLFEQQKNTSKDIELGSGDKTVSDIYNIEEGWVGFCIAEHIGDKLAIGENVPLPANSKTDNDINAFLRIRTTNSAALDVIIETCIKAKARLEAMQQ